MKKTTWVSFMLAIGFSVFSCLAQAQPAINSATATQLANEGVIKTPDELTRIALNTHLGSKLQDDNQLQKMYGRYIYRVALLDKKKVPWNVDLDAQTGEIINNSID